jgi:hypothetical protein
LRARPSRKAPHRDDDRSVARALLSFSFATLFGALLAVAPAAAAELTALETRWLEGIWPVVRFAKASQLPLDIIVQPQDAPGAAPLALGFIDGRCKLASRCAATPRRRRHWSGSSPSSSTPRSS